MPSAILDAVPTTPSNPVHNITQEFGLTLPQWLIVFLSILAAVGLFLGLYKPLGELLGKVWRLAARLFTSKRLASKRARRRAVFADHLESAMRRLAEKEEWRDSRFAELEAEVEIERRSSWHRLRRLFGGPVTARIRRLPSLTAALRTSSERLVVLEGDPGAGKSVALRHVAQGMAADARHRASERTVLPIYVNLKTFRPDGGTPSAEDVRAFVLSSMNPAQSRDIDRFLDDEFDPGRDNGLWLFLFDSFDEIPAILSATEAGPIIETYADAISGFIGMGSSRGVIASREFRGPGRVGWPRFRVMPLTAKRRRTLVRRADLDDAAERMLLDGLGEMEASVRQLADNPLFLSLLCEYVRESKALPDSTHAVMESYVRSRLTRDQERIENRFAVSIDTTRAVAEEMAFQMLSTPEIGLSVTRTRIMSELHQDTDEAGAALDALIYSKLVRYSDDDASGPDAAITFAHRRIQEYFATCVAIRDRDRISHTELLTNGRWRETAVAILQTHDAEELLAEIETMLSARANDDGPTWPPGVLHLLDILANGLRVESPVCAVVDTILDRAWQRGTRLDKKWVVELCAAAGTTRSVEYLARAFDTDSLWLRDHAYAQVRRAGPAANRLEPQIRQMLIDMSVGGGLRRERRSVFAQLQRLPNPRPLRRTVQLLLAAPAAGLVAGLLSAPQGFAQGGWPSGIIGPLTVVPVLLVRYLLASDSRQSHYSPRFVNKIGMSGNTKNFVAAMLAFVSGMAEIAYIALGAATRPTLTNVVLMIVIIWLAAWPYGALVSTRTGAWTATWRLPLLPAYLIRLSLPAFRRWSNPTSITMFAVWFLGGGTLFWAFHKTNFFQILGGATSLLLIALIVLGFVVRSGWQLISDRRAIAALGRDSAESDVVVVILRVLDSVESDEGFRLLLQDIRRRQLHLDPNVADFLEFLGERIEGRTEPHRRQDWVDRLSTVRSLSSDCVDELGRLLEDVRRGAAFGA